VDVNCFHVVIVVTSASSCRMSPASVHPFLWCTHLRLHPVALAQFAREIVFGEELKALAGEGLNLGLFLLLEHGVELLHPHGPLLDVRLLLEGFLRRAHPDTRTHDKLDVTFPIIFRPIQHPQGSSTYGKVAYSENISSMVVAYNGRLFRTTARRVAPIARG
jgi:hypothetical protein